MRVEYKNKCGDFEGPVLDIKVSLPGAPGLDEAFVLGRVFEKIVAQKKCAWTLECGFRIPLIDMDEIGLAVLPKKDNTI